jgi:chromosome segregation ATPase
VSNTRSAPREPNGERGELVRLVQRIQTLTAELDELRRHEAANSQVQAKERRLEQLRWRLAALARRTATDLPRALTTPDYP